MPLSNRNIRFTPKADIVQRGGNVRFVPEADIHQLFDYMIGALSGEMVC